MTRRRLLGNAAMPLLAGRLLAKPRPLFNGRDFTGWKQYAFGIWRIEDGEIVARFDHSRKDQGGPGYLFTTDEFADFTLELDFWVSKGGNSGIFIRQPLREFGARGDARPAQRQGEGVEVQIDYNDPKNLTGSIYNRQKPARVVGGEEKWNRFRIQCSGPRVRVWVDGELANDFDGLPAPKGAIGLQMHGNRPHDHVVRFRSLQLL